MKKILIIRSLRTIFLSALLLTATLVYAQKGTPPLTADFDYSNTCFGDTTEFQSISSEAVNLQWFFGDGTETWSLQTPSHRYAAPGTYVVTLVAYNAQGQTDTHSETIEIFDLPLVTLQYSHEVPVDYGTPVTISVVESFAAYLWSTAEASAAITVTQPGFYTVTVTDNNGCNATVTSIEITMRMPENELDLAANIITPNNDGVNDYFELLNLENYVDKVSVEIFNRWGDSVFESSDYANDDKWDATYEGKTVTAGAFFYIVRVNDTVHLTGTINVLN